MAVRADMRDRRILEERFAVSAPAPLSVEAFPKRHIDGLLGVAHLEEGLALLVRSGHQHVELPVTAFGQFDLLTAARHGVLDILLAHHEPDAVAGQLGRNQLGGEAAALVVETVVGIELVGREGHRVVRQRHGRALHLERGLLRRSCQPHAVGFGSEFAGRNDQRTALGLGCADLLLDAVALLGRENLSREGDAGVLDGLAGQLVAAHDISVAVLGLLQRTHADLRSRGLQHREGAAQRSRMFGSHVSHERQVELLRCGHNAAAVGSLMSYDRIGEVIDTQIEIALVRIAFFGRRSVDQRQTDRIVGGFVPAVFAVVEHRDAVRTVGVGQVGPLQGGHFVCRGRVVAALDKADAEVVSGFRVAHGHRELGFEQRIAAVPVHRRTDVDAVVLRTVGQRNVLHELRIAVRALHLERSAHGPLFADGHRNIVGNGARSLVHDLLQHLPCGPLVRRIAFENRQPEGLALLDQFTAVTLVHERRDIAVPVERQLVNAILDRIAVHFQRRRFGGRCRTDVVDGISHRLHVGGECDHGLVALAAENLRGHAAAVGTVYGHALGFGGERNLGLDNGFDGIGHGVVDHHGRTLDARIERIAQRADRRVHHVAALPQGDQLVVPRPRIGLRDTRTRQVVMELVPDETLPDLGEFPLVVSQRTEPVGGDRSALGGAGRCGGCSISWRSAKYSSP